MTLRCDGFSTAHTKAALEYGASREEIADALVIAIAMKAGAAMVYSARTTGVVT